MRILFAILLILSGILFMAFAACDDVWAEDITLVIWGADAEIIKGAKVIVPENSVSHYLLERTMFEQRISEPKETKHKPIWVDWSLWSPFEQRILREGREAKRKKERNGKIFRATKIVGLPFGILFGLIVLQRVSKRRENEYLEQAAGMSEEPFRLEDWDDR